MIVRTILACLLVALTLAPRPLRAEQGPFQAHIAGRVTSVDYTNDVIVVRTPAGDRRVVVMPSTEIDEPGAAYATVADIRRGSIVEVVASVDNGRIVAEIIHIR